MRRQKFVISHFYCNECKTDMPLPRKRGKMRENGHIKDLYCPVCKKIRKFTERREG